MKFTMRQARNLKGLTQVEMAKKLGIGITTYQHYENGKSKQISLLRAQDFSRIVDIPMKDLIF